MGILLSLKGEASFAYLSFFVGRVYPRPGKRNIISPWHMCDCNSIYLHKSKCVFILIYVLVSRLLRASFTKPNGNRSPFYLCTVSSLPYINTFRIHTRKERSRKNSNISVFRLIMMKIICLNLHNSYFDFTQGNDQRTICFP